MAKSFTRASIIALLAGVSGLFYLLTDRDWTIDNKKRRPREQSEERTSPFGPLEVRPLAPSPLPKEVGQLLGKWIEIKKGAQRFDLVDEVYELARSSITELGCGEDLISLINALVLEDDTIDNVFDEEIRRLLSGKDGGLQCESIAAIRSDPKIRLRWSYFAAIGIPKQELATFLVLLGSSSDREAAKMGNLISQSSEDPLTALRAVVDRIGTGAGGISRDEVFNDIIDAAADVGTFPSIEAEIRGNPELNEFSVYQWRNRLLEKWVLADPISLAAHFNEHPTEMTKRDVRNIVQRVARDNPEKAFELAQNFKDPGHFDSGVLAVLPYIYSLFPKESMELAQQLRLPKDRAKAIDLITNGLPDDINHE
jgi:hypothetical protein